MPLLAALILGSGLTVTAGGIEPLPSAVPAVAPISRTERRRQRRALVDTVGGVALEVGSGLFYAITAQYFIGRDLKLSSAGCSAPDMPCYTGTPIVLFFPAGAVAMGWLGATRLAAAREASIWRSPMFWAGTGFQLASYIVIGLSSHTDTRNGHLFWDTTFIATSIVGTVMQVWGSQTAPPRRVETGTSALHLAPGCAPTSGGVVCGLALAGF